MSKHIMIVDDDPGILSLVGLMLRHGGFEVIQALDAREALDLLNRSIPDLFIIDLMMPGMDGFELCTRLRSQAITDQTPILILSGRGELESRNRCLELGANGYLSKPVLKHDLLQVVSSLLCD